MGKVLQRKKRKSNRPKARRNPKLVHRLPIGPDVVQKNWIKKDTVSNNYDRLGLAVKINHVTGGTEKIGSQNIHLPFQSDLTLRANEINCTPSIPKNSKNGSEGYSEVEVVRDPQTGSILKIKYESNSAETRIPSKFDSLNDCLAHLDSDTEMLDSENDEDHLQDHHKHNLASITITQHDFRKSIVHSSSQANRSPKIIDQIEQAAALPRSCKKRTRTQSYREQEWIRRLVQKHGDDYSAMWRDNRLNPMQQTAADIKRRVATWKLNGGTV